MVLPFIEVSHLPSSSSFFASILQPLGLRYVDSNIPSHQAPQSVVFGTPGCPVLEIRQLSSPIKTSQSTHLVFTAPTKSAVTNFSQRGAQANPMASFQRHKYADGVAWPGTDSIRAMVTDMDGNRVEAVYPDPTLLGNAEQHSSTRARKTLSRSSEVGRILEWNYGVVAPSTNSPKSPLSGSSRQQSRLGNCIEASWQPAQEPPRGSVENRAVTPTVVRSRNARVPESKELSSTVNTSTVIGTLLGIAAGAVLTYGFVSRDKNETAQHGAEVPVSAPRDIESDKRFLPQNNSLVPDHPTRAVTFQHGLQHRNSSSRKSGRRASSVLQDSTAGRTPMTDAARSRRRALDDIADPGIASLERPTMVGRQRIVHASIDRDDMPIENARLVPSVDRCRDSGRLSSVNRHAKGPLLVPSAASRAPSWAPSRISSAAVDTDRETYVSARSHRSSVPSAQLPPHVVPNGADIEPSSSGRWMPTYTDRGLCSTVESRTSARHIPLPESNISSYTSARHVQLPASGIGSSQADWGDDDSGSIVPSDSISCVGDARRHVTGREL